MHPDHGSGKSCYKGAASRVWTERAFGAYAVTLMEEFEKNRAEERRQTRRAWWLMAWLVGLALGVLVWVHLFYDGPAPDDRALLPHFSASSGGNPLQVFCGSVDASLAQSWQNLSDDAKQGKPEARAEIRHFVDAHQALYAAFDRLMASDIRLWRWPGGVELCDMHPKHNEYLNISPISLALKIKIHAFTNDGDSEGAALLSLQLIQFGRALQGAEGTFFHALLSAAAQGTGQKMLEKILPGGNFPPERLRYYLQLLEDGEAFEREQFRFLCRVNYLFFKNAVGDMKDKEMIASSLRPRGASPSFKERALGLLFKQNQTLRLRVALDSPIVEGLDRSWKEGRLAAQKAQKFCEDTNRKKDDMRFYLNPNFEGMKLVVLDGVHNLDLLEKAMTTVVLHRQTRIMLALRLFELEHGKLPQRLEELVPTYLAEVPADVFEDEPMRWNAASGVVYSVGTNETDEGGVISEERRSKGADIGMRYWWSPAKDEASEAP